MEEAFTHTVILFEIKRGPFKIVSSVAHLVKNIASHSISGEYDFLCGALHHYS